MQITYTQEQLDIELLKQTQSELFRAINRIDEDLKEGFKKVESHQKWILSLMSSGFIGLLGLMAHGFKWII
jgi:hypothetical protein